jgi:hypothetical protein
MARQVASHMGRGHVKNSQHMYNLLQHPNSRICCFLMQATT